MEILKIKYHSDQIDKLEYIDDKSDWIDLRSSQHVILKKGEHKLIELGVSIQLPEGYEAIIAPRSSSYKNFKILQTNGIGIVDEKYCGNDDIWKMSVLAMEDTEININDRICQFRIQRHQPKLIFEEVNDMENSNRGGFGSTGKN